MPATTVVAGPPRVMVTGVGGAPGFDLTRSLLRLGCAVIGVDSDPLACGLVLPGVTPAVAASAGDPGYGTRLLDLCRQLRPDALMSTVEAELAKLITLQGDLDSLGVRMWLPPLSAVTACADKAVFHSVLRDHGIPTPRTVLPEGIGELPDGVALVVKPRHGQGAKDVHFCSSRRQAAVLCELVSAPIIQDRLAGREFTADCLVDQTGRASVILRWRLRVKNGLSMMSATFSDDEVTGQVRATLAAVGVVGVCCAQGFLRDAAPDRVVMTEVNARVAGGFPLSEVAGADLVGQALRGLFGLPIDHDRLTYTSGVGLTKYVETLAIGPHLAVAVPVRP